MKKIRTINPITKHYLVILLCGLLLTSTNGLNLSQEEYTTNILSGTIMSDSANNPGNPQFVYNRLVTSAPNQVCCGWTYQIFDPSNIQSPELLASITSEDLPETQNSISFFPIIQGESGVFYLLSNDPDYNYYVNVFENIENPDLISSTFVNITSFNFIIYGDGKLIFIRDNSVFGDVINIVDVSDPEDITVELYDYENTDAQSTKAHGFSDGYYFLSYFSNSDLERQLVAIDISDKEVRYSIPTNDFIVSWFMRNSSLYLMNFDRELLKVDISDPTAMTSEIVITVEESSDSIGMINDHLYIHFEEAKRTQIFDTDYNLVSNTTLNTSHFSPFGYYNGSTASYYVVLLGEDDGNTTNTRIIEYAPFVEEEDEEETFDSTESPLELFGFVVSFSVLVYVKKRKSQVRN